MGRNKIGTDALTLTIAKIVTMLISMVSGMLLSRFRTLEEYGTYSQILLVINLATSLFMLGLPNSTNFFLSRSESRQERRNFLSVYYTLNTCMCFLMGAALVIAVPLIESYFKNKHIGDFIYLLAILPWTKVIISSVSNVLVVYGQTKKLALFNATNGMVAVVAIVIVKLFNWSFQVYMQLYLFGESVMMLWVYFIVSKLESPFRPMLDRKIIQSIFKFSIPIGLASLVGTLTLECDKLVIGQLMDTETLAIYTNAARELPFTIIATSLTAVLLPQMARRMKENKTKEAIELWKNTVELSYLFIAFAVTVLIVYAPQIMTILYSEKYLPGVGVFRVYSLVLLFRITHFGMMLNASGRTKLILYSSIITLIVNVVLDYILYQIIGILGPAIATLISISAAGIVQLIATSRMTGIPFIEVFPWRRIIIHSGINIAWGSIVYLLLKVFDLGVTGKEIICCVLSGIPVVALYLLIERRRMLTLWRTLNAGGSDNLVIKHVNGQEG